jgi:hypothetical protein
MIDPQMVFGRMTKNKQEQKELKTAYRDALTHDKNYQEQAKLLKEARERKIKSEKTIKDSFGPEFNRLDELKQLIADDQMMLSDMAFNSIVKGEKFELFDEHESQYEPILSVKFKKTSKYKE